MLARARNRIVGSGLEANDAIQLPGAESGADHRVHVGQARQSPNIGGDEGVTAIEAERAEIIVAIAEILGVVALPAGVTVSVREGVTIRGRTTGA